MITVSIEFIPYKLIIKPELFENAERLTASDTIDVDFQEYIMLNEFVQTFIDKDSNEIAPNHRALFISYMQPLRADLKLILRTGNKIIFRYICVFEYDETIMLKNLEDFKFVANVEIMSIALDTLSAD